MKSDVQRSTPRISVTALADVATLPVSWLWPGWIPYGKVTLIAGDPGVGKSYLCCDVVSRHTTGRDWPLGKQSLGSGVALMLSAEDSPEDVLRPRLELLHARIDRIHVVRDEPSLLRDAGPLEQAVIDTGANLVIIDPITAYMAGVDANSTVDVRTTMQLLTRTAENTGAAIVVVTHFNKSSQAANYRTVGSMQFTAAARAVHYLVADARDASRRVLCAQKMNIGALPPALAYGLQNGVLVWEEEPLSGINIDQLLSPPQYSHGTEEAIEFVKSVFDDSTGEVPAARILALAKEAGISDRALRTAKNTLDIESVKVGVGNGSSWMWQYPKAKSKE